MNKADVEFTVGLNTSPAEQQLDRFYEKMKSKSNIVFSVNTDSSGFVPTTPRNYPTTFSNDSNSLATTITRELEKVTTYFRAQAQGVSGYRYAGSSTWNEQKRIGYDNLPSTADQRLQESIKFSYANSNKKWRFAGFSSADSIYEEYKNATSNNKRPTDNNNTDNNNDDPVDQSKKVTDENKKDNIELNDKLMKWGKILGIVYSIKKVLEGLSKLWKFNAENISSRNANLNQDLGFFSIDPVGAMRANMDTTRAMMYAGVRNMGDNSPVSKEGLDYMSQKFTDLWTAAMSGREVDARTTIDVQRLKDFFGIDLSVAGLLTGEREGKTATDVQIDVMRKVEAQLAKLNEADETTKGQVIDSLRNILGDEMVNAIVANYNKNMRSDTSVSLIDRLTNAGGSALNGMDLTDKTTKAVTALASFKESLEDLKNTIVVEFSPAFVEVTKALTSLVDWVNRKITDKKQDTLTPGGTGNSLVLNKDLKSTSEGDVFGDKSARKKLAQEKLKNAKSADDILDAVYLLNPNLVNEGSLESIKQNQYINDAYDALASGVLDPDSSNPLERYLANYEYGGKKGLEALKLAEKKGVFGRGKESGMWIFRQAIKGNRLQRPKREDYWKGPVGTLMYNNAETNYQTWFDFFKNFSMFSDFAKGEFGEGGGSDWTPEKGFFDYLLDPSYYKDADAYYEALQKYKDDMGAFGKEYIKSFDLPSKESLWGEDMKLQFDEVVFTLQTTTGEVLSSVRRTPTVSDFQ